MTEPLGEWKNAPLAYVLAEVRTEHLADIEEYHAKIAGKLRDKYPIQRSLRTGNLVATGKNLIFEASDDHAREFAAPDNQTAVILRTTGLVLHATAYRGRSSVFLARLDELVRVFHDVVPSIYFSRLGLRYVDFIVPRKGERPEAYIDSRINPDLGLSSDASGPLTTSVAQYSRTNGLLMIRYARGRGQPQLPPDLGMISLDPSSPMKQSVEGSAITAVLDTDRILVLEKPERLEPDRIHQEFLTMHADISSAFKTTIITPHARQVWGAT